MSNEQALRAEGPRAAAVQSTAGISETLAARGDIESFIQLYRMHVQPVYRYALARLGNTEDAEDATSEVFKRAWNSLPHYRPSGAFKGWLFTIAQRVIADQFRQHGPQTVSLDGLAEVLSDPAAQPEARALAAEQLRQVLVILASFSDEQQEVIRLRFVAELPYEQIATITRKRQSAVKMMAYRALAEIRRRMANVQPETD